MTNPYAALRNARAVIATNRDAFVEANIPAVNYGPIWDSYEKSLGRYGTALSQIDAALAGEGEGNWRETVRDLYDQLITGKLDRASGPDIIRHVVAFIEERHHAFFCDETERPQVVAATPTPAVVRPEDVSDEMVRDGLRHLKFSEEKADDVIRWDHDFACHVSELREFIAWAMTRTPAPTITDAQVEAACGAFYGNGPDEWRGHGVVADGIRKDMRAALEAAGRAA